MKNTTKLTEDFLKQISHHLSGRAKWSNTQYSVYIGNATIDCFPPVEVFPDRYHRQVSDKNTVLYHVIKYHFPILANPNTLDTHFDCSINPDILTPGNYLYKFIYNSSGKKIRRQWTRVESLNNQENNKGDDVDEA